MVTRSLFRSFIVILLCNCQLGLLRRNRFGIITPWDLQYNQPSDIGNLQPVNPNYNPFFSTNQPFISLSTSNPGLINTQSNPHLIFTTPPGNTVPPTNTGFVPTMIFGTSTSANVNNGFILTTPSIPSTVSSSTAATFTNPTGIVTNNSITNSGSITTESGQQLQTNNVMTASVINSTTKTSRSIVSTEGKNDFDTKIIFPTEASIFMSRGQENDINIITNFSTNTSTSPTAPINRPTQSSVIDPLLKIESPTIKIYTTIINPINTNGINKFDKSNDTANSSINTLSVKILPNFDPSETNTITNSSSTNSFIVSLNASQPTPTFQIYANVTNPLITIEFHNSPNANVEVETRKQNTNDAHMSVQKEGLKSISGNIDLSIPNWWNNFGQTTSATTTPISRISPTLSNKMFQRKCTDYSNNVRKARAMVQVFIMGGSDSSEKEFPHMAALGYGNEREKQWLCGGCLISEKYVLTAAHCLNAKYLGDIQYVRLGTTTLQTETLNSEDYRVTRKIAHPQYILGKQYNDIALLELDRQVVFTDYIAPICLAEDTNLTGMTLVAAGWGITDEAGSSGKQLRKVSLSYFPNNACQESYAIVSKQDLPQGILDNSQICAGSSTGHKDTCQGDSGGPLQVTDNGKQYLVGITSFGIGCARPGIPGVYTRVSYFIPWIESIVWNV